MIATVQTPPTATGSTVAALAATVARVVLGVFWLHEGIVKYHAGFGRADILLVVSSAAQNPRVPGFYRVFTNDVLGHVPTLFGVVVPLVETSLGLALIVGLLTLPAALMSVVQLCSYWLADQLIAQYPVMIALSALVILGGLSSSRYSLTTVLLRRSTRQISTTVRRWL